MKQRIIWFAVTMAIMCTVAVADKPKNVYKTVHLTTTQIGISCLNGADPTGRKVGDLLIISCGQ